MERARMCSSSAIDKRCHSPALRTPLRRGAKVVAAGEAALAAKSTTTAGAADHRSDGTADWQRGRRGDQEPVRDIEAAVGASESNHIHLFYVRREPAREISQLRRGCFNRLVHDWTRLLLPRDPGSQKMPGR